ncbi:hypothetical protein SADUNF_Sadunf07G0017000 [Salix dunnii]|uniref:Dehydrin 2 n=1 Tax=Salix dunnii TaxID=1413687 RepID=A0A835K2I3_9ROSI|nr:hypothetical protein SADUNF_Sadunf07G0017000 [Salix dunnii]
MYDGAPVVGTGTVQEYHGFSGKLHHRSGSLSSSSPSEEDGHGGRTKKKGLKEKVKEKLQPGHHDRSQATPTTTPGGYYSAEQHREKKGIMEKIKEKLPGLHHDNHH